MAMEPGMITSNEPGLYRPGRWGIRIENLVLAVPSVETEFGEFLKFETLTLCPIDTRCIELQLLAEGEKAWLNDYHSQVRRSEEHTSELQSLMRISYAVFCLKKKRQHH